MAKNTENTKTSIEFRACGCGCGENIGGKAHYRPGHDARHAGMVGREIAANYATEGYDRREILATLPSDALRAKAERIAETATMKAVAKEAKAKAKAPVDNFEHGSVKVGRWTYPARRNGSKIERNMDRHGRGNWVETDKEFIAAVAAA